MIVAVHVEEWTRGAGNEFSIGPIELGEAGGNRSAAAGGDDQNRDNRDSQQVMQGSTHRRQNIPLLLPLPLPPRRIVR